jgi:hypothetical protein
MNCARMLADLDDDLQGSPTLPADISNTIKYLKTEFADELSTIEGKPIEAIQLSSVYTRITGIAGQPWESHWSGGQSVGAKCHRSSNHECFDWHCDWAPNRRADQ